jgi:hypothetical protein
VQLRLISVSWIVRLCRISRCNSCIARTSYVGSFIGMTQKTSRVLKSLNICTELNENVDIIISLAMSS